MKECSLVVAMERSVVEGLRFSWRFEFLFSKIVAHGLALRCPAGSVFCGFQQPFGVYRGRLPVDVLQTHFAEPRVVASVLFDALEPAHLNYVILVWRQTYLQNRRHARADLSCVYIRRSSYAHRPLTCQSCDTLVPNVVITN